MNHPIPGEYNPPNLRLALLCCRLANGGPGTESLRGFRYIVSYNIHEAVDPHCEVPIWDALDCCWLTTSDLLLRLEADDARRVKWEFHLN